MFKVITAVTNEPVSLVEARLQCKVDSDDTTHDAVLAALITSAREYAEQYTQRGMARQTLEMAFDAFPSYAFDLDRSPVASITSIRYIDNDGVEQTIAPANYSLSLYGLCNTVTPAYGYTWPTARAQRDAVKVLYVTGHSQCPRSCKAAMLIHVELESPLNPHTPEERAAMMRARDALLDSDRIGKVA